MHSNHNEGDFDNDFDSVVDHYPHYDNEQQEIRQEKASRNVSLLLIAIIAIVFWYIFNK